MYQLLEQGPLEEVNMHRKYSTQRTWHKIRQRPWFSSALAVIGLFVFYKLVFSEANEEHADLSAHIWEESAAQVKDAFIHAYHGYEHFAAPNDELRPLSKGWSNNLNGWGVSLFDSLDTLLIMGFQDEFDRALSFVKQANFSHTEDPYVPYFETIIRYLGGLLSAHALSHEQILLQRADELATVLDPIFQTKSGMPLYGVNPSTGETTGPQIGILAEMASLQLEYTYLAKLTGKKDHFERAYNVMRVLDEANLQDTAGMFPVGWNLTTGQPHDAHLSVGAQADSAHEYLLKQYLLTAKTDKASLKMYIRATTHIISKLLYVSPRRHLLYVTDIYDGPNNYTSHVFEHLSCFLPGLLALGAHTLPLDKLDELGVHPSDIDDNGHFGSSGANYKKLLGYDLKKLHIWAAEGLAQTCWLTYADQPSGLGPDEIVMNSVFSKETWDILGNQWGTKHESVLWVDLMEKWKESGSRGAPPGAKEKRPIIYTEEERISGTGKGRDYVVKKAGYLLRPETVESLYILWRVTGNPKWRIRGRTIFHAIEEQAKTTSGYASLRSVEVSPAVKNDDMPSYFLAETLKYLYLMFIKEDPFPFDKWVFNTEAHPFPVFNWTRSERDHFGIHY
ncbi:glycoside hydrolase family 47 protein [Collybia nuda]|uniref:alpha-1,2-Mannosidase n=1 Tax=Collybia nuda TaxID=64659 RepID=A0A9P6CHB8_9AGAR|nr:glycoside hydrolase family 47 protein [Collybia nuda]